MEIPNRVYKYQPASAQAVTNLSSAKLWFSNPAKFNDPFDCALETAISEISDEECRILLKGAPLRLQEVGSKLPPSDLRRHAIEGLNAGIANALKQIGGVCCFSTKVDDMKMWGHYADSHRGFCLEFDTSVPPFSKLKKIDYSETFARLNVERLIRGDIEQVFDLLLTKAEFWRHESEWRLFHGNPDQLFGYERRALSRVYFGARMGEDQQQMCMSLLARTDTKFSVMQLSKERFGLHTKELPEFKLVDYRGQKAESAEQIAPADSAT